MKKIVFAVLGLVLGSLLLLGGGAFAVLMHNYYTPDFDKYEEQYMLVYGDKEEFTDEEIERFREEKRIKYPSYMCGVYSVDMFAAELVDCYDEIDSVCRNYALIVASKYRNDADLNYEVEHVGNTLTFKFTGVGYLENGEPESLDRAFIFDVEGAGADKLPRLVNRADFIGY